MAHGKNTVMPTIDAQVHESERHRPGRRWAAVLRRPAEVTCDDMVAVIDAVGVDGAVTVSPFTMYRHDASYAIDVHVAYLGRLW
jgi:L-fuconolactonase